MIAGSCQILNLHRVSPRCYDLTTVRTGSVHDQIIRATLLADALHATRIIHGEDRPLLVMGAGVAGVALAVAAAKRGAHVTVLEKYDVPFRTLCHCSHRIVDPTEYDWPQPHWREGILPVKTDTESLVEYGGVPKAAIPLPMCRLEAKQLSYLWSTLYGAALLPIPRGSRIQLENGSIQVLYQKNARDLTINDSAAAQKVSCRKPNKPHCKACNTSLVRVSSDKWKEWNKPIAFGAVVSCIGFGTEVTSEKRKRGARRMWNGFKGHQFWRDDDNIRPDSMRSNREGHKPAAILISGAGDGGMQDFQRTATGLFGLDLYDKILDTANILGVRFSPEELMWKAVLAEDEARRAHAWRPIDRTIYRVLEKWHSAYEDVVTKVIEDWLSPQESPKIDDLARTVLRPELWQFLNGERGGLRVLWVIRENVPGHVYGLNRFLSLLVVRLIEHADKRTRKRAPVGFLKNHQITMIKPYDHSCGKPTRCYAARHLVKIEPISPTLGKELVPSVYDLILIRHGQRPSLLLGGAAVPEQQVPFDLPT